MTGPQHYRPEQPSTHEPAKLELRRLTLSGLGLALVGAGFSVAADAGLRRQRGATPLRWVGQGTAGLCLLNAGLSVFGEAVALRALQLSRASEGRV